MDIRPAEPSDCQAIRAVAEDSFTASYALSPQQLETIQNAEFSEDALKAVLDDADQRLFVAEEEVEDETAVRGFAHAVNGDGWTLRWLHVAYDARELGIGSALFERVREEAGDDSQLRTWIFEDAVEGDQFCEQFGFERGESDWVEFDGEELSVAYFDTEGSSEDRGEPAVEVPDAIEADGADRPLDRDDPIPGREAPFFQLDNEGDDDPYGYFCSQCGSTDVVADGLDRLECSECGNVHLADEWDGAYL